MKFSESSCDAFIQALASKNPTPGGGGASALVGAVGIALGNMVGNLTLGKKKYADVQYDIINLMEKANAIQTELIDLIQKDADAFEPLSKAYGMPANTDDEKAEKARVMAEALKECCEPPLQIMHACCEAIKLHKEFAVKGSAIAISDAGCGAVFCKAALQAAGLNVFINTKSMKDRVLAEQLNQEAKMMLERYTAEADKIYEDVATKINPPTHQAK